MTATPQSVFSRLRSELFRYYDTPFALANPDLQAERRAQLDGPGVTWQEPWIEVQPTFVTESLSPAESLRSVSPGGEVGEFATRGLLDGIPALFEHQKGAVAAAARGQNVVLTAGTGSGKTEALFLPVLQQLIEESASWPSAQGSGPAAWWDRGDTFEFQRHGQTHRPAAIRAIVLYPMNALVEDQLVRLRKALESPAVVEWLDTHRGGNRFYFGRYTGQTPVSGRLESQSARQRLRRTLIQQQLLASRARMKDEAIGRHDYRYRVPSIDGAEMRSRWDMQSFPPDILITNYSMLNIMLRRDLEAAMLERTRSWLESSHDSKLTIVVDELHMYRGTAGSEVAFLIRTLLHRLGLSGSPEKVRLLAASASLEKEDPDSLSFLSGFFPAPASSFEIVEGIQVPPPPAGAADLRAHTDAFAALTDEVQGAEANELLAETNAANAVKAACVNPVNGRVEPQPLGAVGVSLFGHHPASEAALAGVFLAIAAASDPGIRVRTHLFFRNIEGVWACSNPRCPGTVSRTNRAGVGKLFPRPRYLCDEDGCGGRVLNLHYCQTCGDVSLGGYRVSDSDRPTTFFYLTPDAPEIDLLPDRALTTQSADSYTIYWPSTDTPQHESKTWKRGGLAMAFKPAVYDPALGSILLKAAGATGWAFVVRGPEEELRQIGPAPQYCFSCNDNWELPVQVTADARYRLQSPIRGQRTGFEKMTQVLTGALRRETGVNQKAILFSDSRQDAAKLAAGVEMRHYQDTLRQLANMRLYAAADTAADLELARAYVEQGARSEAHLQAVIRIGEVDQRIILLLHGLPLSEGDKAAAEVALQSLEAGAPTAAQLRDHVYRNLLALGLNPGGPSPSLQGYPRFAFEGVRRPWTDLFVWGTAPAAKIDPTSQGTELLSAIQRSLTRELQDALFGGRGRDFESIGLGYARPPLEPPPVDGLDPELATATAIGVGRILCDRKRFSGRQSGRPTPPAKVRRYIKAVAEKAHVELSDLEAAVERMLRTAQNEWLIDFDELTIHQPPAEGLKCEECSRLHLAPGAGICTYCVRSTRLQVAKAGSSVADYYSYLARQLPFRLHAEELTGQTDRDDAARRQAYFQDIFLDDEPEAVAGIDVLSVTTTMEAGVDIGSLRTVIMSNVPPMRFNYQQRVGRAGRRGDALSFVLTVCRGRSHDDYYFDRPRRITTDPPPQPTLTLDRPEIIRRVLNAWVLSEAFRELRRTAAGIQHDWGSNVHGEFGPTQEWHLWSDSVTEWIASRSSEVRGAAFALAASTLHSPAQLAAEVAELPSEISRVISSVGAYGDLSQFLAENGMLPMFGFPTSNRYLYLKYPKQAYPWPPKAVIDRPLDMAISTFAPGSQLVKDKWLHTAVGIAGFRPAGGRVVEEPNPFGRVDRLERCSRCSYLNPLGESGNAADGDAAEPAALECPNCGDPGFRLIHLAQPLGFVSNFKPTDYDGSFEWVPRSSTARISPDPRSLVSRQSGNFTLRSGRGRSFVVNDKNGADFTFRPLGAGPGKTRWYEVDHLDGINPSLLSDDTRTYALGATNVTDATLIGIAQYPPWVSLTPFPGAAGKAPWYSLGFALREAAARHLDIQSQELKVGIRVSPVEPTEIFIADELANGAGFSTYLAQAGNFEALIKETAQFFEELEIDANHNCDTSCYDCLRGFYNMAYHPLLDWRLARDMLQLGLDATFDPLRWLDTDERLATTIAETFEGTVALLASVAWSATVYGRTMIIAHPFESTINPGPRLSQAIAAAPYDAAGRAPAVVNSFDLIRRLGRTVTEQLQA